MLKFVLGLFPSVLGKRLGKSMGIVAKEVKAMSQKDILDFEKHGEVTIATHCLKLSDIKVHCCFWLYRPSMSCPTGYLYYAQVLSPFRLRISSMGATFYILTGINSEIALELPFRHQLYYFAEYLLVSLRADILLTFRSTGVSGALII